MNSYLSLLQGNPHYRNLWLARVVSNLGDWFNLLASAALVASLTNSGAAISYLFLARFLPEIVATPYAGVLADRFNRRNLMVAADVLRFFVVLGFLLVRDPAHLWLFYVLTALQFSLSALYNPAHMALIPNVVAQQDLVTANTLDSVTWSTMVAVGSMLGGVATTIFGLEAAFVIDAFSFLVAAFFVARVRVVYADPERAATRGGLRDFADGLRYLRLRPFLLGVALAKAAAALVYGAINVLEVPLANDVFPLGGSGTLTLSLIYTCVGVGTALGPIVLRRFFGDDFRNMLWAIALSFALLAAGALGIALAPTLGWALGAIVVRALGTGAGWVFSAVLLQALVKDAFRGRVAAFEFTALVALQSLSTLWAGFALDRFGLSVQGALALTALVGFAVTLAWLAFQFAMNRRGALQLALQPEP
jgi:MFS family permease